MKNFVQAHGDGTVTEHAVTETGIRHADGPNRGKRRENHFGKGMKGSLASKNRAYMAVAHSLVAEQHAIKRRIARARRVAASSSV